MGNLRYSPFGELVEMSGPLPMFGFTGEQQNFNNTLVYLRAWYYNPALGRFLTPDSLIPDVTNGQSLNAYVYNDPINLVDPTGNIPDVGSAIVNVAKRLPAHTRERLLYDATAGLTFVNWWYAKPDDCNCQRQPLINVPHAAFMNDWILNQSAQAGWAKATLPGQRIASEVIGRVNGRVVGFKTDIDVTKWGWRGPVGNPKVSGVSYFDKGYVVKAGESVSMKVRNPRWQWAKGNRGAMGSVAGAGIIDGIFQVASDTLFGDLCLSPNQIFWRATVAIGFGLVAGTVGLAAGAGAAAFLGITGTAGAAIAFTASLIMTTILYPAKQDSLNAVTGWAY